jgi:hypothetical protein
MLDARLKKVATISSVDEIDGYRWGAKVSGRSLDPAETEALIIRQREIERVGAPKRPGGRHG